MKNFDIALQRLNNQRLSSPNLKKAADVVRWLGAVQAQDYYGAKWALGLRMRAATDEAIEKAFAAGEILRTHVMRPTWHFVTPADIRWLLELTAPRINAANRFYYRKLELDEVVFKLTNKAIAKALQGGRQLTRDALRSVVQRTGVAANDRPDDPQRFNNILFRAELDAVICSGARQGKQFTYALFAERVPETKPRSRDESLADLTRCYFTSHGPAALPDFVWWSGLTVKDAKSGLDMVQQQILKEVIGDKTYWRSASALPMKRSSPVAHLLPSFDEYLVSYKDRSATVEANPSKQQSRGNNMIGPAIIVDGHVVVAGSVRLKESRCASHSTISRRSAKLKGSWSQMLPIATVLSLV